jgi:hypothetical protein
LRAGRLGAAALVALAVLAGVSLSAGDASASGAPPITLGASRKVITAGRPVILSGRIRPPERGRRVRVVDARGRVVATARTHVRGRYSVAIRPWHGLLLRARWEGETSRVLRLGVRARIKVRLANVRLFGTARVEGTVRPAPSSAHAWVRVRHNRRRLITRRVRLGDRGRLRMWFRVRRPGAYRASIGFDDARHVRNRTGSRWRRAPLPALYPGTRSPAVRRLERRLARLDYHITGVNRTFDYRTADALRAFHKVQGLERTPVVSEATWRALARPRRPHPRARGPRFHVEINQTRQVLLLVRGGRVARIVHTSTGLGGATRDGVFGVYRKLVGYSPNRLYFPSYFDGLRAIHGWPDVPPNAASHGCARVPMWTAKWIYRRVPVGTEVRVYH